jgi:hypothetical protein
MRHHWRRILAGAGLGVTLCTGAAFGQTAIVSADGDGVFRAPGAQFTSMLTFKSDDASVKVSFATPTLSGTAGRWTFGADLTAKSSQGLAAVIKSGTYTPGTKVNGYAMRHSLLTNVAEGGDVDWLTVQVSIAATKLVLFDGTRPFADQLTKPVFVSDGVKATYAYEHAGFLMGGLTAGVERTNNYGDLDDIEVGTENTYTDPSTGATRATQADQVAAKSGPYTEGIAGNLRADVFVFPPALGPERLAITGYAATRLSSHHTLRRTDVGVGLALLKAKSPGIALGAVVVELRDAFNSQGAATLGRRLTVSVQGSVPIAPTFGF